MSAAEGKRTNKYRLFEARQRRTVIGAPRAAMAGSAINCKDHR